jgi:hypothetical protein
MDEGKPAKPRTRRRKRHRCINCKKEMSCPSRCLHNFEVDGEPMDKTRRLGLCKACINRLSRNWPPGYPVDDEIRALVHVARQNGVDVRDVLAQTVLDARTKFLAQLNVSSLSHLVEEIMDSPVSRLIHHLAEEQAVRGYLAATASGAHAQQAAAAALAECPSLKSYGNVRKRASLLRRKAAQVTKPARANADSRSRRGRSE